MSITKTIVDKIMKTNDVFFKDTNFVGREVENIQEVVKGMAAKMDFADQDGSGFEYPVEEENDGELTYRNPTEEEVFDCIQESMNEGCKVYMGYFLDCREYNIFPSKNTTMQSDFYVKQSVYSVKDNKIVKAEIKKIQIVRYYDASKSRIQTSSQYELWYSCMGRTYAFTVDDSNIFASVEDLTKHLANNIIG